MNTLVSQPSNGDHGLPLTAADRRLIRAAAEFAEHVVAPSAAAWERDRVPLPREVFKQWAGLRLNALQVTESRGGAGASYFCKIGVAETLARHDMAASFALTNAQGSVTRLEREGSDEQIRRYLPGLMSGEIICAPSLSEPGAGSDFAAIATRAEKVAGGWEISGIKAWVTNGAIADLLVLYAQTDPDKGAGGIASFLVDLHQKGVRRGAPYALMGAHAIGATEIVFDRAFVRDEDLFAPPGKAFKRALNGITGARVHVAAMACAMVEDALGRAVDHVAHRHAFDRPLIEQQGLRWMLADVATELEAARLLTYRAVHLVAEGGDAVLAAAHAKKYAAEMALRSVAACMQAAGANGLRAEEPYGRHLACARVAAYVEGTTEMQRERIGAFLKMRYSRALRQGLNRDLDEA